MKCFVYGSSVFRFAQRIEDKWEEQLGMVAEPMVAYGHAKPYVLSDIAMMKENKLRKKGIY